MCDNINRRTFLGGFAALFVGFLPVKPKPHTDFTYAYSTNDLHYGYVYAWLDGKRIDYAVKADVEDGWVEYILDPFTKDGFGMGQLMTERKTGTVQILFADEERKRKYTELFGNLHRA